MVADPSVEDGFEFWKQRGKKFFYLWRGKGIKQVWTQGNFTRVIKVGSGQINGI